MVDIFDLKNYSEEEEPLLSSVWIEEIDKLNLDLLDPEKISASLLDTNPSMDFVPPHWIQIISIRLSQLKISETNNTKKQILRSLKIFLEITGKILYLRSQRSKSNKNLKNIEES